MTDYLARWTGKRHAGHAIGVQSPIEIVGERNKHLGPRFDFARVAIRVEPNEQFIVVNKIVEEIPEAYGFPDKFIFGVLDEVMTGAPGPIENIKITLKMVEYDSTDSSPNAFTQAGRDAGRKLKTALGLSS